MAGFHGYQMNRTCCQIGQGEAGERKMPIHTCYYQRKQNMQCCGICTVEWRKYEWSTEKAERSQENPGADDG